MLDLEHRVRITCRLRLPQVRVKWMSIVDAQNVDQIHLWQLVSPSWPHCGIWRDLVVVVQSVILNISHNRVACGVLVDERNCFGRIHLLNFILFFYYYSTK